MNKLIVIEKPHKWQLDIPNVDLVSAQDYLSDAAGQMGKNTKVINLCKSYQYQSVGYYVSLLAEARGHKVLPEGFYHTGLSLSFNDKRRCSGF